MEGSVYTPGAGHSPPVLAGRDDLLRDWHLVLNGVAAVGRVRAQDMVLAGPRGVGKTATLTAFAGLANDQGYEVVGLQAVTGQAGLVEALLQRARTRIADQAGPWKRARHAFERIGGVSLSVAGVGTGVAIRQAGAAVPMTDAGNLAAALATLAAEVRRDAPAGGLLVTIDELQVASPADLALLAATLHRLNVDHPGAAVAFAGTGLPHTPETLRQAGVTHPDRLFALEPIPLTLAADDATYAVVEAARQVGVLWEPSAAEAISTVSNGYPAHLQLFAHAAWTEAPGPNRITVADVEAAIPKVAKLIEQRTLGPRWDRIHDRQMEFLAALALLGGRTSTAKVATALGRSTKDLSWIRDALIAEGDIYAPKRGQIAMAVPLLTRYVLTHYEQSRPDAATPLLGLEDMRRNLSGGGSPPATDGPAPS